MGLSWTFTYVTVIRAVRDEGTAVAGLSAFVLLFVAVRCFLEYRCRVRGPHDVSTRAMLAFLPWRQRVGWFKRIKAGRVYAQERSAQGVEPINAISAVNNFRHFNASSHCGHYLVASQVRARRMLSDVRGVIQYGRIEVNDVRMAMVMTRVLKFP